MSLCYSQILTYSKIVFLWLFLNHLLVRLKFPISPTVPRFSTGFPLLLPGRTALSTVDSLSLYSLAPSSVTSSSMPFLEVSQEALHVAPAVSHCYFRQCKISSPPLLSPPLPLPSFTSPVSVFPFLHSLFFFSPLLLFLHPTELSWLVWNSSIHLSHPSLLQCLLQIRGTIPG